MTQASDLPFLECPERVEFSDECYGAIGRALVVAQRFEENCRAVALLVAAYCITVIVRRVEYRLQARGVVGS